jgi:hypothetical protein
MKRHLPLILVSAVIVICLAAAGVAAVAAGVDGTAVAYSVNSTKVSQSTVDDELHWLAGNQQIKKNVEQQGGLVTDASVDSKLTANWLSQRIQTDLLRQAAARQHVVVPAATIRKLHAQATKRFPHAPGSAVDALVDYNAYVAAFGLDTATKQGTFFGTAIRRSHIAIDPRYGSWDPRQGVCPPTGCAPTTAGG